MPTEDKAVKESKEALQKMATPEFHKEISALVRSFTPLIYLVSTEEKRILEYFRHFSVVRQYRTFVWDFYGSLRSIINMEPVGLIVPNGQMLPQPEVTILDYILKEATEEQPDNQKGKIYILLDYHRFFKNCTPDVERRLRTFARIDSGTIIIMVGPHYETTPALDKDMRIIDFPCPNDNEIKKEINSAIETVRNELPELRKNTEPKEEEILRAVAGLSYSEIRNVFAKSICMHREFNIPTILKEKQEVIRKTGVLEFFNPNCTIDDVGGLGNLISHLKSRKATFSQSARDYGLTLPKGILICGVPGTGKSFSAKAAASLFNIPLLRLDFGSLFGSYVGESEKTMRKVISITERLAPVVLWVDEVDKGLSGHRSSGQTDSGVTSRVIGTLLTWMQEKTKLVYLICTANQQENIPSEFMRAGRFDEVFFVDLPSKLERIEIVGKLILRKKRKPEDFGLWDIATKSEGYTGAELEKAVDNALLIGFEDNQREITTEDILKSLGAFKPLSVTRPEHIESMRIWAESRCIKANTPDPVIGVISGIKKIDLGE